jgi:thiamine-phosphate pyrophosphorylase
MDARLVAWALGVKARRRRLGQDFPVLWLFTDARRMPDPLLAIGALPVRGACRGLFGVVFRHDGVAGRLALGLAIARLCRARGIVLVVAGDARMAVRLRAGVHVRASAHPKPMLPTRRRGRGLPVTASAHGTGEVRRARRLGADLVFASPVFATPSHPGAAGLGVLRFAGLCRLHPRVLGLGGVDGFAARRLPRCLCAGAGAIGALDVGGIGGLGGRGGAG